MQRIDENTYIDDTLVTCAEYQLFIDEMRAQGKYYQPDHWTSYQFPKGQAREPVVGVRHADAVAFCEWLTRQNGNEWEFRLPTETEANRVPIQISGAAPLGYWLETNGQFAWIRTIQKEIIERVIVNTRDLDIDIALAHAQANNRTIDLTRTFDLDRVSHPNLDPARDRNLDRNRDLELTRVRASAIKYSSDIYVYIFTLQKRIKGDLPAFEGIRLVKERIR